MIFRIQNNQFNDLNDSMDSTEVVPIKYIYVARQEATENAHGCDEADDGDDFTIGSHYPSSIFNDTGDYDDDADDAVEDDDGYFVGYDEDNNSCCPPPAEESKDLRWSSEQVHIGRPRSQSCSPSMPARESPDVASLRRWSSISKSESATDFAPIMPSRTQPRSRSESSLGHTDLVAEKTAILLPSPSAACQA